METTHFLSVKPMYVEQEVFFGKIQVEIKNKVKSEMIGSHMVLT